MPSKALEKWREQRSSELDELEAAHVALGGGLPGRRRALLTLNHAYTVMLSSAFQGFCRDLHSESVDHLVAYLPSTTLGYLVQRSMTLARKLDAGNPNAGNIGADFGRVFADSKAFWPAVLGSPVSPAMAARRKKLEELNTWRNAIAHQDWREVGGRPALRLATVQGWRSACGMLAGRFDRVVCVELKTSTNKAPW